jgi:exodeoxyribonuclease VII large subunit
MPGPPGLPFDEPDPPDPQRSDRPSRQPAVRPSPAVRPPDPATSRVPATADEAAAPPRARVLSVTDLTVSIRDHLESEFFSVWVEGELSNCKVWNTGHLYFTLKDDRSQIKGFMFKSQLRYLRFKPGDGLHVIARGRVSVYEPKGEYQLTCEHLEPKGLGALQLAYEQLKKRLQAEGLFDQARKRPLPALPRTIGIVTSLDGAAVRDMLKVLGRRYRNAHIVIRPTRVQGDGAALEIARAIRAVGRVAGVDVVIVGRGGGSIEDLWAFNEEAVARAIYDCPVPVISGVGHESDVTIADFVADRRAPTPSAAAEIVVASRNEFVERIDGLEGRLTSAVSLRVKALGRRTDALARRPALAGFPMRLALRGRDVADMSRRLEQQFRARLAGHARGLAGLHRRLEAFDLGRRLETLRTRLAGADGRLGPAARRRLDRARAHLRENAGRLESLSPLAVLGRGYAVAWNADRTHALRRAADVHPGDRIRVTLGSGELECDVTKSEQP